MKAWPVTLKHLVCSLLPTIHIDLANSFCNLWMPWGCMGVITFPTFLVGEPTLFYLFTWLIHFTQIPHKCFSCRWSSLEVHNKQKGYCYLAYEIQILLYFLNQRLHSTRITLMNCVHRFMVCQFWNLNYVIHGFSGFIVWLLKKYQRMIICCLYLRLRYTSH